MGSTLVAAAAEVMHFDRLGEKVRPDTFGEYKSRLTGVPKVPLSNNMKIAVTPLVLTPFVWGFDDNFTNYNFGKQPLECFNMLTFH